MSVASQPAWIDEKGVPWSSDDFDILELSVAKISLITSVRDNGFQKNIKWTGRAVDILAAAFTHYTAGQAPHDIAKAYEQLAAHVKSQGQVLTWHTVAKEFK